MLLFTLKTSKHNDLSCEHMTYNDLETRCYHDVKALQQLLLLFSVTKTNNFFFIILALYKLLNSCISRGTMPVLIYF